MISANPGVKSIKVSLSEKEGIVQYLPENVTPEAISQQINDMGFEAYVKSVNGRSVQKGTVLIL